ncbi:MAG: hypothetical protein HWQ58_10275 [Nostoc sp. LPT]|nr:hypothetical protein [Nostoc sp. LPT]
MQPLHPSQRGLVISWQNQHRILQFFQSYVYFLALLSSCLGNSYLEKGIDVDFLVACWENT